MRSLIVVCLSSGRAPPNVPIWCSASVSSQTFLAEADNIRRCYQHLIECLANLKVSILNKACHSLKLEEQCALPVIMRELA